MPRVVSPLAGRLGIESLARRLVRLRRDRPGATLGTFLRAFTFGHVRQLDKLLAQSLQRAWTAGDGPGAERLVIDVDGFVGEVCGYLR
jgi:hypothetical protein